MIFAARCIAISALVWSSIFISMCAPAQADEETSTEIVQDGLNNDLRLNQNGSNLSASVLINGHENSNANAANSIEQIGRGSTAIVAIEGDQNAFDIRQAGSTTDVANNEALANITGQENTLEILQVNGFGETFFNSGSISQLGDGNFASVSQEINPNELIGGGNLASISQDGYDHIARIRQTGADNSALVDQSGAGNLGTIIQDGEGLAAALYQDGIGLEYRINQTGCVIGTGCGTVSVTQTGP